MDWLYEQALRQFKEMDQKRRLILIHPGYLHARLLLKTFLADPACLYVRFEGQALLDSDLFTQFDAAEQQQWPNSGAAPKALILLDECDRAAPEALERFVSRLLQERDEARIVVMSRRLPPALFADLARTSLAIVPVEPAAMLPNYLELERRKPLLEVKAFGAGAVMLNGRPVEVWDGTLPRSLFFYLIDRGMATRSQIFETFWPDLTTREATNVFHVTKRKINEVLGIDLTVYWSGFYHISTDIDLNYDVALFGEMVRDSAVAKPQDAERLLVIATSLYRGHFLDSLGMEWAQRRRQELAQTYADALTALGKLREQAGRPHDALGLYVRASAFNPHREDLARSIMQLYRDLGMIDDAIATYRRLEAELDRTLGVAPAPSLQELRASIEQDAVRQRA